MILHGECVEKMAELESDSIDCIITSPPYDGIRKYGGDAGFDLHDLGIGIQRVLKDGCFAVMVIADQKKKKRLTLTTARLMIDWVDNCRLSLCDWLIYKRQGRIGRYHSFRRDHESILVFFKGDEPKNINTELLKIPVKNSNVGKIQNISMRENDDSVRVKTKIIQSNMFCRGSVWTYRGWGRSMSERHYGWFKRHPATMRLDFATDLVMAFSNPGDLILDPFTGSGATGSAAINAGRKFLGIEINEEYCSLAKERIAKETSQRSIFPET